MAILNSGDVNGVTRGQAGSQASLIQADGEPMNLAELSQITCITLHGDTNEVDVMRRDSEQQHGGEVESADTETQTLCAGTRGVPAHGVWGFQAVGSRG